MIIELYPPYEGKEGKKEASKRKQPYPYYIYL